MLVLSRRSDEKIVFPNLGVTISVLKIRGQIATLGIDAPPTIRVVREEVAHKPLPEGKEIAASPTHELCNRLSKVNLGLHLFQRQRDAGQNEQAEATLARVFTALEKLDREEISSLMTGRIPSPPPPNRAVRALVVDDDSNERELLAGLLGMNGCECATAANGEEALNYLDANDRPDVVLLDMLMPRCDGPTALRMIRANPRLADLRVFGVSGTPPQELGIPNGPSGIDGWFAKPLNPKNLWDAVQRCLTSSVRCN